MSKGTSGAWDPVYRAIRRIPRGRVATYGQIAELAGGRLSARAVGWALHVCPSDVPWHRVVNAQGGCSTERLIHVPENLQRRLLESEGVSFGEDGRINLAVFRWRA